MNRIPSLNPLSLTQEISEIQKLSNTDGVGSPTKTCITSQVSSYFCENQTHQHTDLCGKNLECEEWHLFPQLYNNSTFTDKSVIFVEKSWQWWQGKSHHIVKGSSWTDTWLPGGCSKISTRRFKWTGRHGQVHNTKVPNICVGWGKAVEFFCF